MSCDDTRFGGRIWDDVPCGKASDAPVVPRLLDELQADVHQTAGGGGPGGRSPGSRRALLCVRVGQRPVGQLPARSLERTRDSGVLKGRRDLHPRMH